MKLAKTITLTVFIQIIYCFSIFSQQPTEEWVARYLGPSNDLRGPYLQLDKFGNSYIAGTHVINDSINILVTKYNSAGVQQWAALYKYTGEGYFSPMGFAVDTFGNAYVTSKYGQDIFNPLNILTIKFDGSNGAVAWAKKYIGRRGYSTPEDIKIDRENNIYVVGSADSALICVKYDMNGDSVWVRRYQPSGFNYGNACTIDDSLNIIITGEKSHCVSFPPPGGCFDTLLTVKYDKNGLLRWAKTYFYPVNPGITTGLKITNDQTGNIYIAGKTRNSLHKRIYLTLKYNRDGIYQWASIYDGPGSGDDNISALTFDRVNNFVFVTGTISGPSNTECATIKYNVLTGDSIWVRRTTGIYNLASGQDIKSDSFGNAYVTGGTGNLSNNNAIMTIKYSPLGNVVWLANYNGPGYGRVLEFDNDNNVFICGPITSDYIIIKYSQPLGITALNHEIPMEFRLSQNYPNPFNPTTQIKFSLPRESFTQIKIYDLLGMEIETVVNEKLKAGTYEAGFDGSNLASGVYFYSLTAEGFNETKKMALTK